MSSPPLETQDLTATDVLSSDAWMGRAGLPALGLDVACTKLAIDLQTLDRGSADEVIRRSLETLAEITGSDCAFVALLDAERRFGQVHAARRGLGVPQPEALRSEPLAQYPWLESRMGHLRLTQLHDTAAPRRGELAEAHRFAGLQMGSVLLAAFQVLGEPAGILALARVQPRGTWDVNLQLLLKLLGASLASSLERLRLGDRLERLEERVQLSQAAANDGLWDFDVERNGVYFSPRWKAMLGYAEDALLDSPDWRNLVHPDDMSRVQGAIRDHVAGKTPVFESVHRMRHRSGEWRWVMSRAQARVDAQGRLMRLVGVELDITERRLYEDALFREKESAQITLQSIGDGVITTDAESVIDYINPVAEELTGWRLEDAMGRPVEEVFRAFHEETCEPLENPLTVSIRRVRPTKSVRPMLLIRRDGNELYVESTAAPIRDGQGKV
ncbi:MAG: PAS domain S-box protein, partial [Steroidobacteraceae bacterium]